MIPFSDETTLVAALRTGDEAAFNALIDRHYATMLRVARLHVGSREAAEDVVQETFLSVLKSIDSFEERASIRTWMFQILVNLAKSWGEREHRIRPFSSFADELESNEPSEDPDRFITEGRWAGYWQAPPELPETRVLAIEVGGVLLAAVQDLPPGQQHVVTLRDIEGFGAAEVCELLGLSEANQRVLLHRARTNIRARLEDYLSLQPEES